MNGLSDLVAMIGDRIPHLSAIKREWPEVVRNQKMIIRVFPRSFQWIDSKQGPKCGNGMAVERLRVNALQKERGSN